LKPISSPRVPPCAGWLNTIRIGPTRNWPLRCRYPVAFVSKWRKLLRQADQDDVMALHSRSRARHRRPASLARPPAVVQRILEIRTTPPENREPRPRSRSHPVVFASRSRAQTRRRAPASVSLHRSGRSCARLAVCERTGAASQSHWNSGNQGRQSSSISKMEVTCPLILWGSGNTWSKSPTCVDAGTSIWLHREVGADFDAETLLEVVAQFLRAHGLPARLTFDHDPREVFSESRPRFPLRTGALPLVSWGGTECSSRRIVQISMPM
jgi:hypothetical protein